MPEDVKYASSEIEWRRIIGLRNIFTHEYFGISLPVVWDVVENKLELLEIACRRLLEDESHCVEEQD